MDFDWYQVCIVQVRYVQEEQTACAMQMADQTMAWLLH